MRTQRLPPWFKVPIGSGERYQSVRRILATRSLHTVCSSAKCPNAGECWNSGTATFLIMGDICTRNCGFCAVPSGQPATIDKTEPSRIRLAAEALDLSYVVVTSVTRDDVEDGGASVFVDVIKELRKSPQKMEIEVLIPDFQGYASAIQKVIDAEPDILNHNIETVPDLYPIARAQADYKRSINLLKRVSEQLGRLRTKSGIMVGMGETRAQLTGVLIDLAQARIGRLTIGQYLQPTRHHMAAARYVTPEEFDEIREEALAIGFDYVASGPLVRSSYHAAEQARKCY
jgi:lipoyl synthase